MKKIILCVLFTLILSVPVHALEITDENKDMVNYIDGVNNSSINSDSIQDKATSDLEDRVEVLESKPEALAGAKDLIDFNAADITANNGRIQVLQSAVNMLSKDLTELMRVATNSIFIEYFDGGYLYEYPYPDYWQVGFLILGRNLLIENETPTFRRGDLELVLVATGTNYSQKDIEDLEAEYLSKECASCTNGLDPSKLPSTGTGNLDLVAFQFKERYEYGAGFYIFNNGVQEYSWK